MTKIRQWSLLTGLGCLALLAAGWFLLVSPQRAQVSSLRAETATQQSANAQVANQIQMRRAQEPGLPAQQAKLAALAQQIPFTPALPALIRSLSSAADAAGVNLLSLSPSTPVAVAPVASAARTTSTGTAPVTRAAAPSLAAINVTLQVSGTYFNVEQFFSNLESMTRVMRVTQLTLGNNTAASKSSFGSSPVLNASITGQVFMNATPDTTSSAGSAGVGH
ncbi:MAG TPA: type 4a pilus biogenesis protein PilO [Mycobacteriales bacterium]|nr:type 4a pilus biogenesis protein PilO [Mycobacteriales bacterium]